VATSPSLVLSVVYPTDFGTNINYVGNYTINVQQNNPTNKPSVATGQFEVGLTDSLSYQRTFPVSIKARGYAASSNVTISVVHGASSYPQWQRADASGVISHSWTIPASALTGVYTVSLSGGPLKNPPDNQTLTIYPTNVTIGQLTVAQPSIQRTLSADLRFTGTYLSGSQVQTGSGTVRITQTDGRTSLLVQANYDSTIASFRATYQVGLSDQAGAWVASVDPGGFDDGYGNGGPVATVVKGFTVEPAILTVTVSVQNKTYVVGDVLAIYASVANPDGSTFDNGNVTAASSRSGIQVGNPIHLVYVSGQQKWTGSLLVNATNPSGVWLIKIRASDLYGNSGEGATSSIVSVPPPQQQNSFYTSWFLALGTLLVLALAVGLVVLKRTRVTRNRLKIDLDAIGLEARKVTGQDFFKSIQEQVKAQEAREKLASFPSAHPPQDKDLPSPEKSDN